MSKGITRKAKGAAPPAPDAPDNERARYWREKVMRLNREALAAMTGFSVSSIGDFEAGRNRSTGGPISPAAWRRYRMACAAVSLGVVFDFEKLEFMRDPR